MTLADLLLDLQRRAREAEAMQATAPVAAVLVSVIEEMQALADGTGTPSSAVVSWRERLWTCPAATRVGVREVAEALGRPRSWVYRAVADKRGPYRLPARRLGGELLFEAGDVRAWVERTEEALPGATVVSR